MSKIVGYAPGCWDLLHVGHVRFLKKARSNCDFLIVGVPTDEVIILDKGRSPIIPCGQRSEMVGSLGCVDLAVVYYKLDFINELRILRPQKLFVGEYWGTDKRHEDAEGYIRSIGGEVFRIAYSQGVSTTLIMDRMRWPGQRTT